jgi:predicted dienelactone hydrolase
MLPMRFFRNRTFTAANVASLFMFVGMFGSIFLLAQYFQTVQGASPLQSGLRILPWTAMPILVAPIAGMLSDRIGGRPIMAAGLALQATGLAWIGAILTATLPYSSIVVPFALSGIGMAMYFAPVANVVLSSVKPEEEGQASGANNAIRELGGVFGVAVLAAVFSHYGGYQSPDSFVRGVTPALYLGAAIVAIGAVAALFIPRRRKTAAEAPVRRSRRVSRRASVTVAVVLVGAIAVSAAAAATATASTGHAANEPVLVITTPTGSYPVGTRSIELVDRSRREPGSKGTKPRSFVVQLWYPRSAANGRPERYMPPAVAAVVAADGGLPVSVLTRLRVAAISGAAPRHRTGGWPVVLFSTGYGVERQLYTGLVQDLASHGYVVAALDHPHDAGIVSFPDGHTVSAGSVGERPNAIAAALAVRIADTRYALDALARLDRGTRTGPFTGLLDLDHVGMFGHSLGGAAAAAAMLVDPRLDAGLDMDGLLFGDAAVSGLRKPFMLFSADPGFRQKPNLARFWARLEGPRYAIDFAGAAHLAFTDLVFLVPQLAGTRDAAAHARLLPLIGSVDAQVVYAAQRAYIRAFFDRVLRDRGEIATRVQTYPGVRATGR